MNWFKRKPRPPENGVVLPVPGIFITWNNGETDEYREGDSNSDTPQTGAETQEDPGPELAGEERGTSAAIGYKVVEFQVGHHWLITKGRAWEDLALNARCNPSGFLGVSTNPYLNLSAIWGAPAPVTTHISPDARCSCGIYIGSSLFPVLGYFNSTVEPMRLCALVLVEGWGKVIEHEQGWRCEYAHILGFITPAEEWGFPVDVRLDESEVLILSRRPDHQIANLYECGYSRIPWLAPHLPTRLNGHGLPD